MTRNLDGDAMIVTLQQDIIDIRRTADSKSPGRLDRMGLLVYSDALEQIVSDIRVGKFDKREE